MVAQLNSRVLELSPQRLPLVARPENRGDASGVDSRLINGYVEAKDSGDIHCYKRPGYSISVEGTGAAAGNGLFQWQDNIYSVFGTSFRKDGTVVGAVDNDMYSFSSCLGATPKLFFQNSAEAYVYDSGGGLVHVVDVNYPAVTVPGAVYLDGTMYVMTPDCYIQGSDINDPTSWDPLNSILAQIEPDFGVGLAKQLSYVIAFKGYSTEVFYDARNAAGSPLGRVESAKLSFGCVDGRTITDIDGALYWFAQAKSGHRCVMMMENLKAKAVSTPAVDRLLATAYTDTAYGYSLYSNGHKFYILSFIDPFSNILTLAYDTKEDLWSEWRRTDGEAGLPFVASVGASVQDISDGRVYFFDAARGYDVEDAFSWDLYTPIYDGGSRLNKACSMLEIVADQQAGGILWVRYSDDDYDNWSQFRGVDLMQERPLLDQMGTFRKRVHHFHHFGPQLLRVKAVDLHIDLGTL
jgi:hypothetical protein